MDDPHKEFLLSALRSAALRVKLMENDLHSIGIALKADLVGTDMAIKWLHDSDLMFLVGVLPPDVGLLTKRERGGGNDGDELLKVREEP